MPEFNSGHIKSSIVSTKVNKDGIFILVGLDLKVLQELDKPEIIATIKELVGQDVIDYLIQLSFQK